MGAGIGQSASLSLVSSAILDVNKNFETPRWSPPVYGWPIHDDLPRKPGPEESERGSFSEISTRPGTCGWW